MQSSSGRVALWTSNLEVKTYITFAGRVSPSRRGCPDGTISPVPFNSLDLHRSPLAVLCSSESCETRTTLYPTTPDRGFWLPSPILSTS